MSSAPDFGASMYPNASPATENTGANGLSVGAESNNAIGFAPGQSTIAGTTFVGLTGGASTGAVV